MMLAKDTYYTAAMASRSRQKKLRQSRICKKGVTIVYDFLILESGELPYFPVCPAVNSTSSCQSDGLSSLTDSFSATIASSFPIIIG